MARLFAYGSTKAVAQPNLLLPGNFYDTLAVPAKVPAVLNAPTLVVEYGEIVELVKKGITANGNEIKRVGSGTTSFGVILRDTAGGLSVSQKFIEAPRPEQALSIYPLLKEGQYFAIAIPVESGQSPVVGNDVYVSIVSGSEGSVRTDASTTPVKGIKVDGWVYASTKYKPTNGNGECVIIARKL